MIFVSMCVFCIVYIVHIKIKIRYIKTLYSLDKSIRIIYLFYKRPKKNEKKIKKTKLPEQKNSLFIYFTFWLFQKYSFFRSVERFFSMNRLNLNAHNVKSVGIFPSSPLSPAHI